MPGCRDESGRFARCSSMGQPLAGFSAEEIAEREAIAKQYPRNPFIYRERFSPFNYTIGFKTSSQRIWYSEPLWWTGQGFKDLGRVRLQPETFLTAEAAEEKVQNEILGHIRRWRADQIHLIIGW